MTVTAQIDPHIKQLFLSCIPNGLYDAKIDIHQSGDIIVSRAGNERYDKVCSSIIKATKTIESLTCAKLQRRSFPVLLLHDQSTNTLYTIMREHTYNKLTKRKNLEKTHYLDGLVDCNGAFELPDQMEFCGMELGDGIQDERLLQRDKQKIAEIKNCVSMLINKYPERHVAICYNISGYKLISISARVISTDMRLLYEECWTNDIDVDYSVFIDDVQENSVDAVDDIVIKLKPTVAAKKDSDELPLYTKETDEEEITSGE